MEEVKDNQKQIDAAKSVKDNQKQIDAAKSAKDNENQGGPASAPKVEAAKNDKPGKIENYSINLAQYHKLIIVGVTTEGQITMTLPGKFEKTTLQYEAKGMLHEALDYYSKDSLCRNVVQNVMFNIRAMVNEIMGKAPPTGSRIIKPH